jgi:hypothetical protein
VLLAVANAIYAVQREPLSESNMKRPTKKQRIKMALEALNASSRECTIASREFVAAQRAVMRAEARMRALGEQWTSDNANYLRAVRSEEP